MLTKTNEGKKEVISVLDYSYSPSLEDIKPIVPNRNLEIGTGPETMKVLITGSPSKNFCLLSYTTQDHFLKDVMGLSSQGPPTSIIKQENTNRHIHTPAGNWQFFQVFLGHVSLCHSL